MGFCSELVVPSPKFQKNEYGGIPPVADPVKETVRGTPPSVGAAPAVAVSGKTEGPAMTMFPQAEACRRGSPPAEVQARSRPGLENSRNRCRLR